MWNSIVSVPDHCLFIYVGFTCILKYKIIAENRSLDFHGYINQSWKALVRGVNILSQLFSLHYTIFWQFLLLALYFIRPFYVELMRHHWCCHKTKSKSITQIYYSSWYVQQLNVDTTLMIVSLRTTIFSLPHNEDKDSASFSKIDYIVIRIMLLSFDVEEDCKLTWCRSGHQLIKTANITLMLYPILLRRMITFLNLSEKSFRTTICTLIRHKIQVPTRLV